jgi:hypothetical protein
VEANKLYESGALFPATAAITAAKPAAASNWETPAASLLSLTIQADDVGNRISNANEFYEKLGGDGNGGVDLTANYSLANDINLEDYRDSNSLPVDSWEGPTGYQGHFFGNGYTIRGLKLKPSQSARNLALFKTLGDGAVVENFSIEAETSQRSDVHNLSFGGILGLVNTSGTRTIRNVHLTGTFEFANITSTFLTVGGLICEFQGAGGGSIIENCSVDLSIDVESTNTATNTSNIIAIGGILAVSRAPVTIRNCRANVDFQIKLANNQKVYIGGIAGMGGTNSALTVSNCYSTGDIVLDNSARTDFSAITNDVFVGGIAGGKRYGENAVSLTIENCAALVKRTLAIEPTGNEDIAHVERIYGGDNPSGSAGVVTFSNNYALKNMRVGKTNGAYPGADDAGDAGSLAGLGKTEAQFKLPATWKTGALGWSDTIWDFDGLTKTGAAFYWPVLKK